MTSNTQIIHHIITLVCSEFGLTSEMLLRKNRPLFIAEPRQVAMYLACETTDMELRDIGESFGKERTTVLYARDSIRDKMDVDERLKQRVNRIKHHLDYQRTARAQKPI